MSNSVGTHCRIQSPDKGLGGQLATMFLRDVVVVMRQGKVEVRVTGLPSLFLLRSFSFLACNILPFHHQLYPYFYAITGKLSMGTGRLNPSLSGPTSLLFCYLVLTRKYSSLARRMALLVMAQHGTTSTSSDCLVQVHVRDGPDRTVKIAHHPATYVLAASRRFFPKIGQPMRMT